MEANPPVKEEVKVIKGMTVISRRKYFLCKYCPTAYNLKDDLTRHMATHRKPPPSSFPCPKCGTSCATEHALDVHLRTHTGDKVVTCATCGKGFTRARNLKVHMRTVHTGETPYKCVSCPKSFKHCRSLRDHTARTHVEGSEEKLEPKAKPDNQVKTSPEKNDGPENELKFYADQDFHLNRVSYAQGVDLRTHTGEKVASCATCGKGFTRVKTLKVHMRIVHSGETPYKCDSCHMAFRYTRSLKAHKARAHVEGSQEKAFKCTDHGCHKEFAARATRDSHLKVHTGEKVTTCAICGKGFTRVESVKLHMRSVHMGETRYRCDSCPMAFRYPRTLRKHKARAHVEGSDEKIESKSKAENQQPIETLKTSLRKSIGPENGLEFYVDQDFNLKQISHTQGVHLGTHTGEKVASCATCGKGFTRVKTLKVHMRIVHSGETPYKCDSCHMAFRYTRSLRAHKARAHVEGIQENVEPKVIVENQVPIEILSTGTEGNDGPENGLEFYVDQDFRLKELSIPLRRITCKSAGCGVQEWSSSEGGSHYVCCRCGRGHRNKSTAQGHALRCKVQVCRLCRKSFASPFSLDRHLASVHDKVAHQHWCRFSGPRFFHPSALRHRESKHRENSIQDLPLEDPNILGL